MRLLKSTPVKNGIVIVFSSGGFISFFSDEKMDYSVSFIGTQFF